MNTTEPKVVHTASSADKQMPSQTHKYCECITFCTGHTQLIDSVRIAYTFIAVIFRFLLNAQWAANITMQCQWDLPVHLHKWSNRLFTTWLLIVLDTTQGGWHCNTPSCPLAPGCSIIKTCSHMSWCNASITSVRHTDQACCQFQLHTWKFRQVVCVLQQKSPDHEYH